MKRTLAFVLVSVFSLFVAVSGAYAADVARFQSKGASATAVFNSLDGSGCISTNVVLIASDMTTKVGGPPSDIASLFVSVSQTDWCNVLTLRNITEVISLGPNEFTGSKQLDGASLVTSTSVYDYATASYVTLSLNIGWTGEGDVFRGMSQSHSWSGTYLLVQRGSGSFRSATATGVVSDGVTNYAPDPSQFGQLSYTANSSLTVSQ
ncbi:MAG: hypothetical protein Q7R73_05610 [bacterium]|nr:hypothetical protein [bacterium]